MRDPRGPARGTAVLGGLPASWVVAALGLLVLTVAGTWFAVFAFHHPIKFNVLDGRVYLGGASAVLHGHPLYDARFTNVHLPFLYPPFAALTYLPLTLVPAGFAHTFIKVANVALVVLVAQVSCRESAVPRWARAGVILALIGGAFWFEPVAQTFAFGQLNLALLALVLLDVTDHHGRVPQGVLTGIATGLKLTPAIFIVYLALTGRRRSAGRAIATFAATVVIGLLAIPGESWHYFTGGFADPHVPVAFISNQSLRGVLSRFSGSAHGWTGLWLCCAAVIFVVGLGAARWWQRRSELSGALLCGLTGLLVSPISWTHHWVWAIPAVALTVGWAWQRRTPARLALALATIELWLSYAVWSVPHSHGRELHLRGVQLLTGNLYAWLAIGLVLVSAAAALWQHRVATSTGSDGELSAPAAGLGGAEDRPS